MQRGSPFRNRQSESGAAGFTTACGDAHDEALEDLVAHIFWNLGTEVDDVCHHRTARIVHMRLDEHTGVVEGMLERVGDDVRVQLT